MSELMDALSYLGGMAEKPGRAVRGLLAGRPREGLAVLPFSDALGVTAEADRVYGRDLMGQWGLETGDETGDFALGLGIDLATDPLMYLGLGVGGRAAAGVARGGLDDLAANAGRGAAGAGKAGGSVDPWAAGAVDPVAPLPDTGGALSQRLAQMGAGIDDLPAPAQMPVGPAAAEYPTLYEATAHANVANRSNAARLADDALPAFPDPPAPPVPTVYPAPKPPPAYADFEWKLGPSGYVNHDDVARLDVRGRPLAHATDPAKMQPVIDAMESAPSLAKDLMMEGASTRTTHEVVAGAWDDALARIADTGPEGLAALRADPQWRSALTRRLAELQLAREFHPVLGIDAGMEFWHRLFAQEELIGKTLFGPDWLPASRASVTDLQLQAIGPGRSPLLEGLAAHQGMLRDVVSGAFHPAKMYPGGYVDRVLGQNPMLRPDLTVARDIAGRVDAGHAADSLITDAVALADEGLPPHLYGFYSGATGEVPAYALKGAVRTDPAAAAAYSDILAAMEAAGLDVARLPVPPARLRRLLERHQNATTTVRPQAQVDEGLAAELERLRQMDLPIPDEPPGWIYP